MDNKPKQASNKGWKGLINKKAHSRSASGNVPEEIVQNNESESSPNTSSTLSSSPSQTNSPQTPSVSRGRSRTVTRTQSTDEGEKITSDEYSLSPTTPTSTRKSIQSFQISNIFLAEFDIDKGSIVRYKYPDTFPYHYTETEIAAQMLPDGSHAYAEDVSYFFLRKNEQKWKEVEDKKRKDETEKLGIVRESVDEYQERLQNFKNEPELLYCVTVIKMKQLKGVRRNARVKSLAIASTNPIISCLVPILSKALDKIFDCDRSAQMMTQEKEKELKQMQSEGNLSGSSSVDSMVIDPVLADFTPETLTKLLYDELKKISLQKAPLLSETEKLVWRFTIADNKTPTIQEKFEFLGQTIPYTIPLAILDNELYEPKISVGSLIERFKEKIMILFHAVLYEKRIFFLGYNMPAGDVCSIVLSCCLLVPQLFGLVRRRAFPYASFSDLDVLKVPGFIAGVCNPIFKQHPEWWDVFVDLTTGEIKVSDVNNNNSSTQAGASIDGFEMIDSLSGNFTGSNVSASSLEDDVCHITEEDSSFVQKTLSMISMQRKKKVEEAVIEDCVRSGLRNYAQNCIDWVLEEDGKQEKVLKKEDQKPSYDAFFEMDEDSKSTNTATSTTTTTQPTTSTSNMGKRSKKVAVSNWAIKGNRWRRTYSYFFYKKAAETQQSNSLDPEVYQDIKRLRNTGQMENSTTNQSVLLESDLISIYQRFVKHVRQYQHMMEFLSLLPEIKGGLYPIVIGIFHNSVAVRLCIVAFIRRLLSLKEGSKAMEKLNFFLQLAYENNSRTLPNTN